MINQLEFFKWSATIIMIAAAITISISNNFAIVHWPYAMFLIGHVIWSVVAIISKDKSLFWLNFGLMPIDAYAVYIRI